MSPNMMDLLFWVMIVLAIGYPILLLLELARIRHALEVIALAVARPQVTVEVDMDDI